MNTQTNSNEDPRSMDYFKEPDGLTKRIERVPGQRRRDLVRRIIAEMGPDAVPEKLWNEGWASPLPDPMGIGGLDWRSRGGEDLPPMRPGQVEVARLVLLDSVHGEVTSLRAQRTPKGRIRYEMVDEYMLHEEYDFELPIPESDGPLTAEQVLHQFMHSDPLGISDHCRMGFRSRFYPDLEELAREKGLRVGMDDGDEGGDG